MVKFFQPEQEEQIIQAIKAAELNTSGEIRVHLDDKCRGNVRRVAIKTFHRLGMQKTAARNGILFFIAPDRKEFIILGDEGINQVVPENYWQDVRDVLQGHFREGNFAKGLVEGIGMVGEKLKSFFPYQSDDVNELPDDISYS